MSEVFWLITLASLVFIFSFVALQLTTGKRRLDERLDDSKRKSDTDSDADLILGPMTPVLSQAFQTSARSGLEKELRAAGYYHREAVTEFTAVRTLIVILSLLITAAVALIVPESYMGIVIGAGFILTILAFGGPRVYLGFRGQQRRWEIQHGLPLAVDLLTLGLTAGQHLQIALQRVSDEVRNSYPALAQELQFVRHQAELTSMRHSLQQFAERVEISEVQNLTLILTQSERLGTDTSSALMEFSNNYRTNLKQHAESRANRASFWMLFPAVICLWMPATVLLIGPVFFEFFHRREEMKDLFNPKSSIQELSPSPSMQQGQPETNNPEF